jgi:hypothetical protein
MQSQHAAELVTASDGEVMVDREILEDVMREFIGGG